MTHDEMLRVTMYFNLAKSLNVKGLLSANNRRETITSVAKRDAKTANCSESKEKLPLSVCKSP